MVVGGSVGGGRVVGVKSMAAAACRNELSDGVIAFSLIGRRAARRRPADGAPPVRRPPHPPLDDLILFFCLFFVCFVCFSFFFVAVVAVAFDWCSPPVFHGIYRVLLRFDKV